MAKKIAFVVTVFVLVFSLTMSIGCTVAWIFTSTDPVVNTFEYGDVNIELKEDKLNDDGTLDKDAPVYANTYKFVPGDTLAKRPYVTVKSNSEACWLFIKIEDENNTFTGLTDDIIQWAVKSEWQPLTGVPGVWYIEVSAANAKAGITYEILLDNQVSVNENLTKAMINDANFKKPTFKFTAYAVQKAHIDSVAEAWTIAQGANP